MANLRTLFGMFISGAQYKDVPIDLIDLSNGSYAIPIVDMGTGGGLQPITIADGDDVGEGPTTAVAVQGDTAGSVNAKLRGLNKAVGVTGDTAITTDVSGTVLGFLRGIVKLLAGTLTTNAMVSNFPATQPVSAVGLPLPTGAATSANQTALNALFPTALGQGTMATSFKVVFASDQSTLVVSQVVGTTTTATKPVTNTATSLLTSQAKRMSFVIINNDTTRTLYVNTTNAVTADVTTGGNIAIPPATASTIASFGGGYISTTWYGIYASAGTGYVTVIEEIAP